MVGAEPVGLTDCLNFGSPERPEIMRQLALAVDGISDACRALGVPVVSGNVSLYNETDGRAILPTPTIGAVGLIRDAGDVVRATFPRAGLTILLLGSLAGGPLGGSEYLTQRLGAVRGPPPRIDLALEAQVQALVLDLLRARPRLLESAHDVSDGGLATALAESCTASDDPHAMVGASVTLPEVETLASALFGEAPSRVVASADENNLDEIGRLARTRQVPMTVLGTTGGDGLVIAQAMTDVVSVSLTLLREARARCLVEIVGT